MHPGEIQKVQNFMMITILQLAWQALSSGMQIKTVSFTVWLAVLQKKL